MHQFVSSNEIMDSLLVAIGKTILSLFLLLTIEASHSSVGLAPQAFLPHTSWEFALFNLKRVLCG